MKRHRARSADSEGTTSKSLQRTRRWYDRLSPWYDLLIDPFESSPREAGIELLAPQPGSAVLDIGCGTGTALADIAAAVGTDGKALGIDLSAGMCRRARGRLRDHGFRQAGVVMGDARALPFADGTFDAAFASFVLELFDPSEIPFVAREWRRILPPDGTMVVVALSDRSTGPTVRAYEWLHRQFPTRVDCRPIPVTQILRSSGFRLDECRERSIAGLPIDVVRASPC